MNMIKRISLVGEVGWRGVKQWNLLGEFYSELLCQFSKELSRLAEDIYAWTYQYHY